MLSVTRFILCTFTQSEEEWARDSDGRRNRGTWIRAEPKVYGFSDSPFPFHRPPPAGPFFFLFFLQPQRMKVPSHFLAPQKEQSMMSRVRPKSVLTLISMLYLSKACSLALLAPRGLRIAVHKHSVLFRERSCAIMR